MKTNKQLKPLIIATVIGAQLSISALAADGSVTATNGTAEIPALAADSGSSADASEIKTLKSEIDDLVKKVNALEQQRGPTEQAATIQNLDQQVRVLQRQRELDQDAAVAKSTTAPKISLGANGFIFSSGD